VLSADIKKDRAFELDALFLKSILQLVLNHSGKNGVWIFPGAAFIVAGCRWRERLALQMAGR
jgi:hypothetical protein